ncbi:hypothetical protein FOA52_000435 [Chlamydomonas sp. UWO 241]|nr:hypothetical protein FOA52_000435 [Chlamydomonas sp. UWO 241]
MAKTLALTSRRAALTLCTTRARPSSRHTLNVVAFKGGEDAPAKEAVQTRQSSSGVPVSRDQGQAAPAKKQVSNKEVAPAFRRWSDTLMQMQHDMDTLFDRMIPDFDNDLLPGPRLARRLASPLLPRMLASPAFDFPKNTSWMLKPVEGGGQRTLAHRLASPLLPRLLASPAFGFPDDTSWMLNPVDVEEGDAAYVIMAEVPGFAKEDIKVAVSEGVLSLTAECNKEEKEEGKGSGGEEAKKDAKSVVRRAHRHFSRSFRLPSDAHPDGITASAEHGVLTITVPKATKDVKPPKTIPIS